MSRPTGSCFGRLLIAPAMIVGALSLLVWNEGDSLAMHRSLDEAIEHTIILDDLDQVDDWNEGEMVHAVGKAVTTDTLKDNIFGVYVQALKLRRNAEMYQWTEDSHEEKHTRSDGTEETETVYEYSRTWAGHHIDSHRFYDEYGHENPDNMPYQSQVWTANPITLGAFTLPYVMVNQMDWYDHYNEGVSVKEISDPSVQALAKPWRENTGIYLGNNPHFPQIGDEHFWWDYVVQRQTISFCAVQVGNTFQPYVASAGKAVLLLEPGNHTVEYLYATAHNTATMWAFIWRTVGFVCLWAGFMAILEPLTFLAEHVPVAGPLLGRAVGAIAAVATGFVAMIVCSIVIVSAWIAYRIAALDFLVWGIPVFLVVGGAVGMLYLWITKRKRRRPVQYFSETGNNSLSVSNKVPYEPIPEAEAEIVVGTPETYSNKHQFQAGNPDIPSAPPFYMDGKSYSKGEP